MKTKLPSLPLFTDSFTAETVHLSNQALGIYTRLLCFAWTKNTRPFNTESAYRICQCVNDECKKEVDNVLNEFFKKIKDPTDEMIWTVDLWIHKRLIKEYEYLQEYYNKKSESGKKGASKRWKSANSESMAPIPIPNPIPTNNNFDIFWSMISNKRGSKKMAKSKYEKECKDQDPTNIAKIFNYFSSKIKDKTFVPHVSTWLNQRRFEDEDVQIQQKSAIIETKLPDGRKYKTIGAYGDYFEILIDGEKWYKHKYKHDEELKKDI